MYPHFSHCSVSSSKNMFQRYIPQMIYGAFDGTVTTFAIVAAAAGANLSARTIVVVGLSKLLADAVSMSSGAYLSAKSEDDHKHEAVCISTWTFLAFVIIGFAPIAPYVFWLDNFVLSCILTAIVFFSIGATKGHAEKTNIIFSGLQSFVMGTTAALVAFFVGKWLGDMG